MRALIPALILAPILIASIPVPAAAADATGATDRASLAERVRAVFVQDRCASISAAPKTGYGPGQSAIVFRFRCQGDRTTATAMLADLQGKAGLQVDKVATYPGADPQTRQPTVDVRFVAVSGADAVD